MFAVAAETGWPEERILLMPLARLAQYQHCLLRRNGVRTGWSSVEAGKVSLQEQLAALRIQWNRVDNPDYLTESPLASGFALAGQS